MPCVWNHNWYHTFVYICNRLYSYVPGVPVDGKTVPTKPLTATSYCTSATSVGAISSCAEIASPARNRGLKSMTSCDNPVLMANMRNSFPPRSSTDSANSVETGAFRNKPSISSRVPVGAVLSQSRQPNFVPLEQKLLRNVMLWFKQDEQLLLTSVEKCWEVEYDETPPLFNPSRFVMVRVQSCSGLEFSPIVVLDISADRCGLSVSYCCDLSSVAVTYRCSVKLAGLVVGEAIGNTALNAKMSAATKALCYLSKICPTIIVKSHNTEMAIKDDITSDVITPAHFDSQVSYTHFD